MADEVNLGKTLVARGVITKALDHLWEEPGSVEQIDIVYICSNAQIARQICPSGPLDEVPATSMMLPTRTALEYPTLDHFLLDGTDVLFIATSSDG